MIFESFFKNLNEIAVDCSKHGEAFKLKFTVENTEMRCQISVTNPTNGNKLITPVYVRELTDLDPTRSDSIAIDFAQSFVTASNLNNPLRDIQDRIVSWRGE